MEGNRSLKGVFMPSTNLENRSGAVILTLLSFMVLAGIMGFMESSLHSRNEIKARIHLNTPDGTVQEITTSGKDASLLSVRDDTSPKFGDIVKGTITTSTYFGSGLFQVCIRTADQVRCGFAGSALDARVGRTAYLRSADISANGTLDNRFYGRSPGSWFISEDDAQMLVTKYNFKIVDK